jgi:hypothetical protein
MSLPSSIIKHELPNSFTLFLNLLKSLLVSSALRDTDARDKFSLLETESFSGQISCKYFPAKSPWEKYLLSSAYI